MLSDFRSFKKVTLLLLLIPLASTQILKDESCFSNIGGCDTGLHCAQDIQ